MALSDPPLVLVLSFMAVLDDLVATVPTRTEVVLAMVALLRSVPTAVLVRGKTVLALPVVLEMGAKRLPKPSDPGNCIIDREKPKNVRISKPNPVTDCKILTRSLV